MTSPPFQTPFPGYDVLDKWDTPSWNDATRRVVADRLHNVPERRFFDAETFALLRAVVDRILPQPERSEAERIPLEYFIDARLAGNVADGTRFADALPPRQAWPIGLAAIEEEARRRHGEGFASLSYENQGAILTAIDAGDVPPEPWGDLSPGRFFRDILLKTAAKLYYAHPSAWSEMGFGGPAAPRGYLRLGPDDRDPWEAREARPPQKLEPPE